MNTLCYVRIHCGAFMTEEKPRFSLLLFSSFLSIINSMFFLGVGVEESELHLFHIFHPFSPLKIFLPTPKCSSLAAPPLALRHTLIICNIAFDSITK